MRSIGSIVGKFKSCLGEVDAQDSCLWLLRLLPLEPRCTARSRTATSIVRTNSISEQDMFRCGILVSASAEIASIGGSCVFFHAKGNAVYIVTMVLYGARQDRSRQLYFFPFWGMPLCLWHRFQNEGLEDGRRRG